MKFKGTKGNWRLENLFGNWLIITDKNDVLNIKDNEANAKLIAASPELLAAALKALDECCDLISTDAGNALDEAIKKATE